MTVPPVLPRPTLAEQVAIGSLQGLIDLAERFSGVDHQEVKGVLREGLIDSLLSSFLPPPYRAGTGIITDWRGRQTGQCDIVIWDDGIFRPLLMMRGVGIYPIESVVATIEVKSTFDRDAIRQAIGLTTALKTFSILREPLPDGRQEWSDEPGILPINILFGFSTDLKSTSEAARALNVAEETGIPLWQYLQCICVPGRPSVAFHQNGYTEFAPDPARPFYEVRMIFSGLLNSIKDISRKRGHPRLGNYLVP